VNLSFLKGTRIIALDIETTARAPSKAFVRELGVAEYVDGEFVRGNGAIFSGGVCDPGALAVHGISDKMVAGKPTFASKAADYCRYTYGAIILGHNVIKYDLKIIGRFLESEGFSLRGPKGDEEVKVIDTLPLARKHLRAPSNRLEDLCQYFGIEHGKHRGFGDAVSAWNLFLKIVELTGCTDLSEYITVM